MRPNPLMPTRTVTGCSSVQTAARVTNATQAGQATPADGCQGDPGRRSGLAGRLLAEPAARGHRLQVTEVGRPRPARSVRTAPSRGASSSATAVESSPGALGSSGSSAPPSHRAPSGPASSRAVANDSRTSGGSAFVADQCGRAPGVQQRPGDRQTLAEGRRRERGGRRDDRHDIAAPGPGQVDELGCRGHTARPAPDSGLQHGRADQREGRCGRQRPRLPPLHQRDRDGPRSGPGLSPGRGRPATAPCRAGPASGAGRAARRRAAPAGAGRPAGRRRRARPRPGPRRPAGRPAARTTSGRRRADRRRGVRCREPRTVQPAARSTAPSTAPARATCGIRC